MVTWQECTTVWRRQRGRRRCNAALPELHNHHQDQDHHEDQNHHQDQDHHYDQNHHQDQDHHGHDDDDDYISLVEFQVDDDDDLPAH